MPQPRAAKDHHTSEHVRVAQVPGHLFAPQVLQAQRFPGGRRGHVVEDCGQESTHTGMAGRAVHKPGKRGIRVHASSGVGRRTCGHGTGTASRSSHMLVLGILVHGQRDIVSAETFSGRGQSGRVLGPVPGHRPRNVIQDVAHQRGARVLHGDFQRT